MPPLLLSYRDRVEAIYVAYAPDKLDRVDMIMAKYAGSEEQLIATLVSKYGPEPTAAERSDDIELQVSEQFGADRADTEDFLHRLETMDTINASQVPPGAENDEDGRAAPAAPAAADETASSSDDAAANEEAPATAFEAYGDSAAAFEGGSGAAAAPEVEAPAEEDWYEAYRRERQAERRRLFLVIGGGVLLGIGFLLLIVLIATSYTPVDRQNFGIRYNPSTGRIDDSQVFGSGHHFWSPTAQALQYPSTWRRVQLRREELEVAVASGQVLRIQCEFRYQFKKSTLIRIVRTFGTLEEKAVHSAAVGALKNAAPRFTFEQYVTSRDLVTDGLHAAVAAGLLAAGIDVALPRPAFILGFVELPSTVLALNQDVFFQTELRIRNEFAKQAAVVRLATLTNESLITAVADAVRANASSTRDRMRAVAAHRGTARLQSETGRLVKELAGRLGVATAAGHGALAEYSLLLAALEGTVTTISPDPAADAAAAAAAAGTATANATASGESAVPRGFTLLDGDQTGMTPMLF